MKNKPNTYSIVVFKLTNKLFKYYHIKICKGGIHF